MNTRKSDNLRPCPFCGNIPTMTKKGEVIRMGVVADRYFVGCDNCEENKLVLYCSTHLKDIYTLADIKQVGYTFGNSEEEVINRWNTRPIEDALRAENERLRKALSKIKGSAGLPGLTGQDYINAIEFKLAECRAIARANRIRNMEELIEKGNHAINENCKLRQRIRELEEQQRWIPVSERLPEEGEYVSVIFGEDEKTVGCWFLETETEEYQVIGFEYKQWEVWNFGESKFVYVDEPPTHWRPLPEPPEEK